MKKLNLVPRVCFGMLLLVATGFAQENYATWGKSKPIRINTSVSGANVTDTLYNYPLLVRLDSTHADVFAQAKSGGADLRFRHFPGGPLAYRIDNWDSAARKAEIWVSTHVIYPNDSTQVIHMLWQKSDAPAASSAAAVFDSAKGFSSVWHMGGAMGNRANSTPGGVPAVPATMVSGGSFTGRSTRGVVGAADSLQGGSFVNGGEYFDVSPQPGFGTGFTLSFWANVSSVADRSWMRFFDFGNGLGQDNLFAGRNGTTTTVRWDVFPGQFVDAANALAVGQWKHYTMTVGAIDNVNFLPSPVELFVDGVSAGTATGTFSDVERLASYLGRSNWEDAYFTGLMDEVHISKVARKAGWAKLSFATQRPGANTLIFGATGTPVGIASSPARRTASQLHVTVRDGAYTFALPAILDDASARRLAVHDLHGRTVWSTQAARGVDAVRWDVRSAEGRALARGAYVVSVANSRGELLHEARFIHAP